MGGLRCGRPRRWAPPFARGAGPTCWGGGRTAPGASRPSTPFRAAGAASLRPLPISTRLVRCPPDARPDGAGDLSWARHALTAALAGVAALRPPETAGHLRRVGRYSRRLAESAARSPAFAGQIDATFMELLESCAPLHDLGTAALPEYLLLKPGPLTPEDSVLIQTHTTLGADLVREVA